MRLVKFALFPLSIGTYVASMFLPVLSLSRFHQDPMPGLEAAWDSLSIARGFFSLQVFDRSYWGSAHDVRDELLLLLMSAANIFMLLSPFLIYLLRPRIAVWSCLIFF